MTKTHLVEFHQLVVAEVETMLQSMRSVSLCLDGRSDGNVTQIEHIIAGQSEHVFFLDEIEVHGEDKTTERMVESLKEAKAYLAKLGVKTCGMSRTGLGYLADRRWPTW